MYIDTGNHPHICFKPPISGLHEFRVFCKLLVWMDENSVAEDDYRPWGALVVIYAKPYQ